MNWPLIIRSTIVGTLVTLGCFLIAVLAIFLIFTSLTNRPFELYLVLLFPVGALAAGVISYFRSANSPIGHALVAFLLTCLTSILAIIIILVLFFLAFAIICGSQGCITLF